ncbi:MAG: polysaccharide deacetylase family protein [Clostridia bacterium]|nr:polysaccharide deacetylase family protein [Clostridia bacterium]MCL6520868.1 polysaccharide deacetylase family protein [Bacillota bacterium]
MFVLHLDLGHAVRRRAALLAGLLGLLLLLEGGLRLAAELPTAGRPGPLERVATRQPELVLTFDVAWGQQVAMQVLDVLHEEHVQAVFFVSGAWAAEYPELLRRMAADGHEVGSLGYRQINMSQYGPEVIREEMRQAGDVLSRVTGRQPRFFRAPNGDYSSAVVQTAVQEGYVPVRWSLDSQDWLGPGTDYIRRRVLRLARPGDLILMNANDTDSQTPLALRQIIQGLREKGFRFVTLSRLLADAGVRPAPAPAR